LDVSVQLNLRHQIGLTEDGNLRSYEHCVARENIVKIKSMSVAELWAIHEEIVSLLTCKTTEEKSIVDLRLRQLGFAKPTEEVARGRRLYPQVVTKFRNPARPSETGPAEEVNHGG
jgi:hypothetical protein